jgi:hypothetical protein
MIPLHVSPTVTCGNISPRIAIRITAGDKEAGSIRPTTADAQYFHHTRGLSPTSQLSSPQGAEANAPTRGAK